jgi:hypothetical protein
LIVELGVSTPQRRQFVSDFLNDRILAIRLRQVAVRVVHAPFFPATLGEEFLMKVKHIGLFVAAVMGFGLVTSPSEASVIDTTPGLLYHLVASQGVTQSGGAVSIWADQSGNGNNFTQSNALQQPTFIANSAAFNNQPVIQFNGIASYTAESRLVLNTDVGTAQTVFIVESITSNNGLDGIWGQNEGDDGIRRHDSNNWQAPSNGGNGNDFPSSIFINGVATTTQANNGVGVVLTAVGNADFSATGLGDYFDCCGAGARPFGGDIAEVAVYSGTLTAGQQTAIEQFLEAEYFPTPEPASVVSLSSMGAVGLLIVARRRRRKA